MSDSRGKEVERRVEPDFVVFRITGNLQYGHTGLTRVPVLVSEGKREDVEDTTGLMYQCWEQASYLFEKFSATTSLIVLAWEGRNWNIHVIRRGHSRTLSANTDSGYDSVIEQALPPSLERPMHSGSVVGLATLDHLIDTITGCIRKPH